MRFNHAIITMAILLSLIPDIAIAKENVFTAYLFVYFTGNEKDEEQIRFAISRDGYNFNALNDNRPILESTEISSTGGVRDPHILRGEDGQFYMVVTDMVSATSANLTSVDWKE